MALADTLTLPRFPDAKRDDAETQRWIATTTFPQLFQQWPLLQPLPPGWRESSAEEAKRPQTVSAVPVRIIAAPLSEESQLVALSTAELATARVAARRRARTPREARFARFSRRPRTPRVARLARPPRAPRPARRPRPPKLARRPRRPRKPRGPRQKTKYSIGWCKRPSCFCWTPAGCIGPEMLEAVKLAGLLETAPDCYPGPCYDYGACVSGRCFSEVSCVIQGILRFWVNQYRAASAYVAPLVVEAVAPIRRVGLRVLVPGPLPVAPVPAPVPGLPAGAITNGCPPGWYWTIGLTGCRCSPPGLNLPPATAAQLAQCGVFLEGV